MRVPLVTSHAACKGHAPENTLAGIRRALALGVDAIEIDVHVTADGVPVLMHDDSVERTTDGTGKMSEMTFDEVRRLDAGARQFVPQFQGEKVPSLAEVVALTKSHALLQIEIKQPGVADQVAQVVRDADAIADCETHSFWPQLVREMRAAEPRMAAVLLTDGRMVKDWDEFYSFALSLGAQGTSVHYGAAAPEVVARAHRRSLTFLCWTVDSEPDVDAMIDAGVDSICSNFPDVVRAVLDRRAGARARR